MLRAPTVVAAAWPTARVSHLGSAGVTVLLGTLPTAVTLVRGGSLGGPQAVVLGLAAGAALGWAGEDPCAEVLAPLPVATPTRTSLRGLALLCVAAVVVSLLGVVVALGPGLPADLPDRVPEMLTAGAAALGLSLYVNRRGTTGAGATGVAAGLLVPGFVSAMAYRWPDVLPSFMQGGAHRRWWLLAAALGAIVVWVGRDPARR